MAAALIQPGQSVLMRRAAAAALARAPHPETQPTLLAALRDPDPQVRAYAAEALGLVGNEAAWSDLVATAQDNSRLLQGTVGDVARRAVAMLERRGRQAPPARAPEAG